jgi:hypothetical protein
VLLSQVVFSANMALLGVSALLILNYVRRHPELGPAPMPAALFRGARLRIVGVIVLSAMAVAIGAFIPFPSMGNIAFMLMAVITPLSRRVERNASRPPAPAARASAR